MLIIIYFIYLLFKDVGEQIYIKKEEQNIIKQDCKKKFIEQECENVTKSKIFKQKCDEWYKCINSKTLNENTLKLYVETILNYLNSIFEEMKFHTIVVISLIIAIALILFRLISSIF